MATLMDLFRINQIIAERDSLKMINESLERTLKEKNASIRSAYAQIEELDLKNSQLNDLLADRTSDNIKQAEEIKRLQEQAKVYEVTTESQAERIRDLVTEASNKGDQITLLETQVKSLKWWLEYALDFLEDQYPADKPPATSTPNIDLAPYLIWRSAQIIIKGARVLMPETD